MRTVAAGGEDRPSEQAPHDCQRYAELIAGYSDSRGYPFSTTGARVTFWVGYKQKRATPTVSLTGTASWSSSDAAPSISSPTVNGVPVSVAATVAQHVMSLTLNPGTGGLLVTADL